MASLESSSLSQLRSYIVKKKPYNTQKVKDLDLIKRLTRNAAKAASRGYLKPSIVAESLSKSINKAIAVFSFFKATLLAL